MNDALTFAALVGETLTAVHGMSPGSEEVRLETASGRTFRLYHEPDCCESVTLNEVIGNPDDLLGVPLLKADEASNADEPAPAGEYGPPESFTWTFYTLATVRGYVTLRWLGESNGYYSESVAFAEVR